jgi:hypothetical protein
VDFIITQHYPWRSKHHHLRSKLEHYADVWSRARTAKKTILLEASSSHHHWCIIDASLA